MDPLTAKSILTDVVEMSNFDPAGQDPDFRLREPGVVRGVVIQGSYKNTPAYLKIILDESGEREVAQTKWLASQLTAGPLRTPAVLSYGWSWGKCWMITQDVGEKQIIGDGYPISTPEQKAEMAQAFWLMANTFPQPEGEREPQDYDAGLWFAWKITEWLRIAESYETFKQGVISRDEIHRAHRRIQRICSSKFVSMRFTHAHFSNEELRKDEKGIYRLIDFGATRWRPAMYDAAFCMWHVGMHLWELGEDAFVDEMRKWQDAFVWTSPGPIRTNTFRGPLRACLIERCIGAVAIDIGGKRGVVATLSQEEETQLLANWRAYLVSLL